MSLYKIANSLLVSARTAALAVSSRCCCVGDFTWCHRIIDACCNEKFVCKLTSEGSLGPCDTATDARCSAGTEEPCQCGPCAPCSHPCEVCVEGRCLRIEDCCDEEHPCPECYQCIDKECVPCGDCQKCEDGVCVDCPACICDPPKKYYCCYETCDDKRYGTDNTTCKEAVLNESGEYESPCGTDGYQLDDYGNPVPCDLTKSGPFDSDIQCEESCNRYKCEQYGCGISRCVRDPNGPYANLASCEAACQPEPCTGPCTWSSTGTTVTALANADRASTFYTIDSCERELCVAYSSLESRPIRVQIWAPTLDSNCAVVATRVLKVDSGWRGRQCCDCDTRPDGPISGGPQGFVQWTKPRGITSFEVAILTARCHETPLEWQLTCDTACSTTLTAPQWCPCEEASDCAEGCGCQAGRCFECAVPFSETNCVAVANGWTATYDGWCEDTCYKWYEAIWGTFGECVSYFCGAGGDCINTVQQYCCLCYEEGAAP